MKVLQWCRANAMPVIAVLAAAVTAVFVPPDSAYLGYYDVKTLSCLFCILAVVCALRGAGLFPLLAQRLVRAFHTARSAVTALVVVTLIGSMLLTNDTALLTFLPLSWFVLKGTGQTKHTALTFILQNCAANLGGMLTPFGNPQNLYLFNHYTIPNGEFLTIMLPPFLLSTALILACCLLIPRETLTVPAQETPVDKRRCIVYGVLFCTAAAMVLRGIPYWLGLAAITAALLVLDRVLKLLAYRDKLHFSGKILRLTHLENPGFFLGAGSRYRFILRWVPLLVWIAAAILLLPHVERRLSPARLGILLVLTGGLSNQYDRMRRGSVTDYVQLPRAGKRLGRLVWNVADFMLLGGVVLTVIGVIREMLKG